jgi:CBS domain-containing protein
MRVADVMTRNPVVCRLDTPLSAAATIMRDRDIGDLLVEEDGRLVGIVTDRDIVVRGLAEGRNPEIVTVGDIATGPVESVETEADVNEAARRMEQNAIRRLAVIDATGRPVGIVTLGDLAAAVDGDSALGSISSAPPNN